MRFGLRKVKLQYFLKIHLHLDIILIHSCIYIFISRYLLVHNLDFYIKSQFLDTDQTGTQKVYFWFCMNEPSPAFSIQIIMLLLVTKSSLLQTNLDLRNEKKISWFVHVLPHFSLQFILQYCRAVAISGFFFHLLKECVLFCCIHTTLCCNKQNTAFSTPKPAFSFIQPIQK